jgi:hypothetical protein
MTLKCLETGGGAMDSAARAHFYAAIERAELVDDPFPHLYARDVFPADFYNSLLENLPALDHYTQYSKKYSERYSLDITQETVKKLGPAAPFWTGFEGWLNSSEMLNAMLNRFGPRMKMCYSLREKFIQKAMTPEGVTVSPQSFLCRDFANFALQPHSDAGPKLVVGVFYLSKDDSLVEFGTSLYRPKDPTLREFYGSQRFPFDQFDRVRTFENRPNSFAAFLKTDNSFHGVEDRPYPNVGRDVLFWIPRIGKIPPSARVGSTPSTETEVSFTVPPSVFKPERELVSS